MSNKIDTAMILAAGFGTRLRSITGDIPKPLVDINGTNPLEINIHSLLNSGFCQKIIINIHWQSDKITNFITRLDEEIKSKIMIIEERPTILDTGGGIMNAMQLTGTNTLIIKNADILLFSTIKFDIYNYLLNKWDENRMDALLLLTHKKNFMRGDFSLSSNGKLIRSPKIDDYQYTGCSIISSRFFASKHNIEPFSITDILFQSNSDNYNKYRFYGLIAPDYIEFHDIGTPDSLRTVRKMTAIML